MNKIYKVNGFDDEGCDEFEILVVADSSASAVQCAVEQFGESAATHVETLGGYFCANEGDNDEG